jgi:hypothetical protein
MCSHIRNRVDRFPWARWDSGLACRLRETGPSGHLQARRIFRGQNPEGGQARRSAGGAADDPDQQREGQWTSWGTIFGVSLTELLQPG